MHLYVIILYQLIQSGNISIVFSNMKLTWFALQLLLAVLRLTLMKILLPLLEGILLHKAMGSSFRPQRKSGVSNKSRN